MLTTIAIASSCLTQTWVSSSTGTTSAIGIGEPHHPSCWPGTRDLSTTISPAICPVGYVSACNAGSPRDASETVWACCPSGFHCDPGYYSCISDATSGASKTYTVTDTDILGNTITRQWITDGGINAHSVRVAFHSSDLIAPASPTPTASSPSADPNNNNNNHDAGNLPTGAIAGIGVGAGIGSFILLLGVAWVVWKRYRSKRMAVPSGQEAEGPESKSAPYHSSARPVGVHGGEIDGAPGLYELDTRNAVGELPGDRLGGGVDGGRGG
ncbi:hypothetical protein F4677DRAFT_428434 [Hypoxylon crocopeplum]|nr:hypothetical protein F4677DRAFT_428434 [Hypoxylon crocopeplum]